MRRKRASKSKLLHSIEFYTNALHVATQIPDATSQDAAQRSTLRATLYFNRAQSHFLLKNYGLCISDSCKAIQLRPTYYKAFYRCVVAGKLQEARTLCSAVLQQHSQEPIPSELVEQFRKLLHNIDERCRQVTSAHTTRQRELIVERKERQDCEDAIIRTLQRRNIVVSSTL
uniref:Uncharacterized protein n=1 Tax=Lygus hesperus TaxID=30085 RepID=A0A0A9WTV4_LYGHE